MRCDLLLPFALWCALAAAASAETASEVQRAAELLIDTADEAVRAERIGVAASTYGTALIEELDGRARRANREGDQVDALMLADLTARVASVVGDELAYVDALLLAADAHMRIAQYGESLEASAGALRGAQELGNVEAESTAWSVIGHVALSRGDLRRAHTCYQRAYDTLDESVDRATLSNALNQLGGVHSVLGNDDLALELLSRSLTIDREVGRQHAVAATLVNLGELQARMRRLDDALTTLEAARRLTTELNTRWWLGLCLELIGDVRLDRGETELALEAYASALEVTEETANPMASVAALLGMSRVRLVENRPRAALRSAQRAGHLASAIENPDLVWQADVAVGRAYERLGLPTDARRAYERSIAVIEAMRGRASGTEEDEQGFFARLVEPYLRLVSLDIASGRKWSALVVAERSRARILSDVLRSGRVPVERAMTRDERDTERRLERELGQSNRAVAASEVGALDRREQARRSLEAFRTSLFASHPELAVRRGALPTLTRAAARALLADDQTAAIEFIVTDQQTHLFILTCAGDGEVRVDLRSSALGRAELESRVDELRTALAQRDLRAGSKAEALFDSLMGPARSQIAGRTRLLVVPDGPLWSLPFQALKPRPDRFLIEDMTIAYAPSLTVIPAMRALHHDRAAERSVLAIGGAAIDDGTEASLRRIASVYDETARVRFGAEANETGVKAGAGRYRVIHFATHAVLDDRAPMYSHLLLRTSSTEPFDDGYLEARELLGLELRAELVVLAACESARGAVSLGEGVIGMTWALFIAGAPTTVASQWNVDATATSALMESFHRRRATASLGSWRTAEALRGAMLELAAEPRFKHPYYWAGFVLMGAPD